MKIVSTFEELSSGEVVQECYLIRPPRMSFCFVVDGRRFIPEDACLEILDRLPEARKNELVGSTNYQLWWTLLPPADFGWDMTSLGVMKFWDEERARKFLEGSAV